MQSYPLPTNGITDMAGQKQSKYDAEIYGCATMAIFNGGYGIYYGSA